MTHNAMIERSMGIEANNVLLCEDGDALLLDNAGLHRDGKVPAGYVYVDGTVGDIGHGVLRDRRVLSEEGVVMAVVTVDIAHLELVGSPLIVTRGWIYAAEAEDLIEAASQEVGRAVNMALSTGARDQETLARSLRKALGKFVGESTHRRPMIVPVVLVV